MSADLVPVTDVQAIEALDPQSREIAVTHMLAESRAWLANAMATTDPTTVADLRIWLASVEQWTRRFNLAKEIREDAQEMLRRAEYGISQKVVEGQSSGEIETVAEARRRGGLTRQHIEQANELKPQPTDFVSPSEWHGGGGKPGISALAEVSPEQFNEAIEEAKAEGNLSRANVVRKIKDEPGTGPRQADDPKRLERIRLLANKGWTHRRIGSEDPVGRPAQRRAELIRLRRLRCRWRVTERDSTKNLTKAGTQCLSTQWTTTRTRTASGAAAA